MTARAIVIASALAVPLTGCGPSAGRIEASQTVRDIDMANLPLSENDVASLGKGCMAVSQRVYGKSFTTTGTFRIDPALNRHFRERLATQFEDVPDKSPAINDFFLINTDFTDSSGVPERRGYGCVFHQTAPDLVGFVNTADTDYVSYEQNIEMIERICTLSGLDVRRAYINSAKCI